MSEFNTVRDSRRLVMGISLGVSVLMLVGKTTAYFLTNSSAVMADASESLVHGVATSFAAFSLWYGSRPANKTYPYGHGRITYFSAGFEGALVFVASLAVIASGVYGLIHGPRLERLGTGVTITMALALINVALGVSLVRVGKKTNSLVLTANGTHVLSDVYTTGAAVVGLALVMITGIEILDPIAAILMGLFIMGGGVSLLRSSIGGLMDRLPEAMGKRLDMALALRSEEPMIREIHEVRARQIDNEIWLELHVLVDGSICVEEAHAAVTRFENSIQLALGEYDLRVNSHLEPARHKEAHPEGH